MVTFSSFTSFLGDFSRTLALNLTVHPPIHHPSIHLSSSHLFIIYLSNMHESIHPYPSIHPFIHPSSIHPLSIHPPVHLLCLHACIHPSGSSLLPSELSPYWTVKSSIRAHKQITFHTSLPRLPFGQGHCGVYDAPNALSGYGVTCHICCLQRGLSHCWH